MTSNDIAKMTGVALRTVNKWAEKNGVEYTGEGKRKTYQWDESALNDFQKRAPRGRPSTKQGRGGKRPGAGRPAVNNKRIHRGMAFNDHEWELIKANAAKCGLSVREYIFSLVEKDGQ